MDMKWSSAQHLLGHPLNQQTEKKTTCRLLVGQALKIPDTHFLAMNTSDPQQLFEVGSSINWVRVINIFYPTFCFIFLVFLLHFPIIFALFFGCPFVCLCVVHEYCDSYCTMA